MKTDRELLELAAKAAGREVWFDHQGRCCEMGYSVEWNPLADDGDALRLAVACGINPIQCTDSVDAMHFDSCIVETELFIDHNGDKNAATRRAIVRAASQIQLDKESK